MPLSINASHKAEAEVGGASCGAEGDGEGGGGEGFCPLSTVCGVVNDEAEG